MTCGPVLPVPVADQEQDRRAERRAVADPAEDLGAVLLDRLARAAAVALLAAGEVDREGVGGQRQARRHALDRDARGRGRAIRRRSGIGRRPSVARRRGSAVRSVTSASPARRRLAGRRSPSAAGSPVGRRAGRLALGRAQPAGPGLGQLLLHQLERRRLAGPQRERRRALVEEHQLAVGDRRSRPPPRRAAAGSWRR